ncbi:MAG: hypothetical protein ABSF83_04165 [Nitrososphaerales archaeon]
MESRREGIAPAVIAAVVIVIIAVAAFGAYALLAKSGPSSTTSTSSSTVIPTTSTASFSSSSTALAITTSTTSSSSIPTTTSSGTTTTSSRSSPSTTGSTDTTTTAASGSSYTCSTSSSGSTPNLNVLPLYSYSGMVVVYNETSQSSTGTQSSGNIQQSYSLEYASATTYKVSITLENSSHVIGQYDAYVLRNGAVAAITETVSGQNINITGSEANEFASGIFAGFVFQADIIDNLGTYTATNFFHSTGTTTVSIGAYTFSATTYQANNLPETITNCDGTTTALTAFSLTVGTPTGATSPLAVSAHYAGSTTVDGATTTTSVYVHVTEVTVAPEQA